MLKICKIESTSRLQVKAETPHRLAVWVFAVCDSSNWRTLITHDDWSLALPARLKPLESLQIAAASNFQGPSSFKSSNSIHTVSKERVPSPQHAPILCYVYKRIASIDSMIVLCCFPVGCFSFASKIFESSSYSTLDSTLPTRHRAPATVWCAFFNNFCCILYTAILPFILRISARSRVCCHHGKLSTAIPSTKLTKIGVRFEDEYAAYR